MTSRPRKQNDEEPAAADEGAQDNVALVVDDTAAVPQAPYDALERGYHGHAAADLGVDVDERDVASFARHAELDADEGRRQAPVQATTRGDAKA